MELVYLHSKIKTLSIMLFEAEQRVKFLQEEMDAKDKMIKDLNVDIYFSDLEVQEMKKIIDLSENVEYMISLQKQVGDLSKANELLSYEITL